MERHIYSPDAEPQVILIASAGPQKGKTLTATNLAITTAQSGSSVIILDCDLRRSNAVVLSKFTDGTVYVIRAHETVRGVMVNGLDQLRAVGAHLLGAILNGADMIRDGYYSNYCYYYSREGKKKKK